MLNNKNNLGIHPNLTHRSFELTPFVEKLPLQIECLTCYDNFFIIGTNCGRMLINEVKPNQSAPGTVEPVFDKSISATKRPIQQLDAIKPFDILIALFDAQIHIFSLNKFQLQYSIAKTKGCSSFATSISKDQKTLRLCVVYKKKLQFYYVNIMNKNNQFKELMSDLELNDVARNLKFTKENLIVFTLRKDYYYYEIPSVSAELQPGAVVKQPESKFSSGLRLMEPLCEKLHNEYLAIGVDENKTIIYDCQGKPCLEYPILWSGTPAVVCSVGPYLLATLSNTNCVEVVTIQSCVDQKSGRMASVSVQMIEFLKESVGGAQSMQQQQGSTGTSLTSTSSFLTNAVTNTVTSTVSTIAGSLTSSYSSSSIGANIAPADRIKILKSNGNCVCYVATQSNVWCLTPIKINEQLEQALRYKNYELGLNLISSHEYFSASDCPFGKSWLEALSRGGRANDSGVLLPFFSLKSMSYDLDESLMRRLRNFNALDLFSRKKFTESFQLFQQLKTDPSHLIAFVPGLLPDKYRNLLKFDEYYPSLDAKELEEAIAGLIDYLQFKRNEFLRENKPLNDPTNFSLIPLIDGRPVSKTREKILEIIDTTLLKCYLKTKENLVQFFLRREPNFLHAEESERLLVQHGKIAELIILYGKKNLHEKALGLLMSEASKANSALHGFKHIVEYLKKNGAKNFALTLKYARLVIEADAKWGMKIFMGDAAKIDEILEKRAKQKEENLKKKRKSLTNIKSVIGANGSSNNSLLSVLLKINTGDNEDGRESGVKSSKASNKTSGVAILDDDDDERVKAFSHQAVCNFLKDQISPAELSQNLLRTYLQYCIFVWNDKDPNLNNDLIDSYMSLIESSSQQATNESTSNNFRKILIYFLNETNNYEPNFALSKLELSKYPEERAIVLGKLGKHLEALSIYVNVLNDTDKAEAYCDNVYSQSNILDSKQVYYTLLQIYLNSDYEEIRIGASIRLLNAHSNEIGSCRSLQLLPADLMKCQNLTPFFESMLNRIVRNKHNIQVINRLMFALELQIHETKIMCQDKKFYVTDEQICKECNKRMGKSAMVRFPNGDLIHYGCSKNSEAFAKRQNH